MEERWNVEFRGMNSITVLQCDNSHFGILKRKSAVTAMANMHSTSMIMINLAFVQVYYGRLVILPKHIHNSLC